MTINSIQEIIRGLRGSGISILITDHREQETLAITDRSYVVRDGRVLCHGTPEEVLSNPEARKYYFGDSPAMAPQLRRPRHLKERMRRSKKVASRRSSP